MLFGIVTVGLIATHGVLSASTSGGVPTDYLGWLLRTELSHTQIQTDPGHVGERRATADDASSTAQADADALSAQESIHLASLRNPAVRLDRARPLLPEHNQVVIERISRGDTLSSVLQRQNISLRTIYAIARGARPVFNLSANLQTGKLVKLMFDRSGQLISVAYPMDEGATLVVKRVEQGDFKGTVEKGDIGVASLSSDTSTRLPNSDQKADGQPSAVVSTVPETVPDGQAVSQSQGMVASAGLPKDDAKSAPATSSIPIKVKSGDYLTGILASRNIDETIAMEVARASKPVYDLARMLQPGKILNVDLSPEGLLLALSYPVDDESIFWLRNDGNNGFVPKIEKKVFHSRLETVSGTIRTDGSLFAAGGRSGLTHSQSAALVDLFEWDIDFARDIRAGDSFSVVREVRYYEGKRSGDGRIIAAEFINQGKAHRVVYYTSPKGESGYYEADGQSIRKMFIRAPVDFRRISSLFSSNRKHPVFGFTRAHKGVDYAADMGTPVRAAADGVVIHAAVKSSFGKLILIRHNGKYTTAYAHLHRYSNGIRPGTRVRQGQVIGQVGMTGATTGPHLHYEVRVYDKQVDPLSVQMAAADPVSQRYISDFRAKTSPLLAMLKSGGTNKVASLTTDQRLR
ncbi:MAG: peptidoglycan DD-metalloendopeptidase family protein [Magnetococcales bacterium]|nr:peptidoglycan DD-metalloendopeptidase family protein [Magnetococcales bacterium]